MKTIAELNSDSRPPVSIPVYTLPDMVPAAAAADFVLQRLETSFFSIHGHMPAHRHDHYEISWFTGGRGSIAVDTVAYTIVPPMLHHLSPSQVHTARFSSLLTGYSIHFTRAFSYIASVVAAVEQLTPWRFEGRYVLPDGSIHWWQGISTPTRDNRDAILFNGVLLDITERKQAEEAMRQSQIQQEIMRCVVPVGFDGCTNGCVQSRAAPRLCGVERTISTHATRNIAVVGGSLRGDVTNTNLHLFRC
jgi:hypothetical protein